MFARTNLTEGHTAQAHTSIFGQPLPEEQLPLRVPCVLGGNPQRLRKNRRSVRMPHGTTQHKSNSAASVPPRFCLGAVFVNEKREWKVRSPAALKPSSFHWFQASYPSFCHVRIWPFLHRLQEGFCESPDKSWKMCFSEGTLLAAMFLNATCVSYLSFLENKHTNVFPR